MTRTLLLRWAVRGGLVGVAAVALTAAGLAGIGSAQAATGNPYAPSYGHPYRHGAVPTVAAHQQMQSFGTAHPNAVAPAGANLAYGGGVDGIGVTTGHERVYLVFYGSQWGTSGTDGNGNTTFSGDTNGMAPRLQQLFKALGVNELWSGVMTQYCEGIASGSQTCPASSAHVAYPTGGGTLAGVWADTSSASPTQATGHQLGLQALAAAQHFGNTTGLANRNAQYVIVSPHGTNPDGFNTSSGQFCAWHDWNGDPTLPGGAVSSSVGDFAFTNMPYVTDAGTSCGQGFVNSGSAGTLDGVTIVEGHEYAETVTDQNPAGGWTDNTGEENGDKCAWVTTGAGASANVAFSTGNFAMQTTWSNDVNDCRMSHAIVGGGGGGNTVTVTNPGSRTGTVGTATSLQIQASDSSSSATLTFSATGLPTGLSISSSGLISGIPSAAGSFGVTVKATDNTGASGTASFTWMINPSGGGGCSSPGQKITNPGFESGNTPWTATAGVLGNTSGQSAHTGTRYAWLDGYGTTHTDTLSQSVTIPAGCTTYTLSFWLHIDSAETTTTTQFDKLTVKVGTTTLATYSNLNKATGYSQKSFNVSAFAGQTVTLTFSGTEDSSLQTSFVIDDTALNVS
jgi:hypothetical protein